jgi:hypothetical protein
LDRLHRVDAIRDQIFEIRKLALTNIVATAYAKCLIHSILALSVFYHDDDEGLTDASVALELAQVHGIPRLLLRAYNRKIFGYGLRARLHTPDGVSLTQSALEWAARSGDLRSKATIYNTVGCYYLDTHDLTAAEKAFREVLWFTGTWVN